MPVPVMPPTPPLSPGDPPTSKEPSASPARSIRPRAKSTRSRACEQCHSSKITCGGWNEEMECGTCRRKGLCCSGPSTAAPVVDPNKVKRKPKGSVMHQLKASLATMSSTLSQLNSVQLSASLQRALVMTANELDEQALAVAGATFRKDNYNFHKRDGKLSLVDVQIVSLAALGARTSSHSQIIGGSSTSPQPAGQTRLLPFKALVDRAYKVSTASGLLSIKLKPTLESYETLILLRYALTGMVNRHEGYDEVNQVVLRQRNALLADPTLTEADKAKVTDKEAVSLLLCDCIQAIQVEAETCCFTDHDLERDFGWSLDRLSADLAFIKSSAAAGPGSIRPESGPGICANQVFDAVARLSVWVVRTLVDLRRQGWQGDVAFDAVVPTLGSVTQTLFDLGLAFDQFRETVDRLKRGSGQPDDMKLWQFCLRFVERKLIGYNMLVWDVAAILVANAGPGSSPLDSAEHAELVGEVELRAAQSIRFLLTETETHKILVPDYFHKPSFLGGYFSALPPGVEAVQLAVRCVREGRSGGQSPLAGVGMELVHLEVFLSSLRQTSELMGPAAEQADELERGIAALRDEAERETARTMVEGALADLRTD